MIELLNCDCMEYMATVPDKYFDLAIVDPPYGIGGSRGVGTYSREALNYSAANDKRWDTKIPPKEYFDELRRISNNQIVFGANYMTEHLPSSRGWICWYKSDEVKGRDFSEIELAYSSFNKAARHFECRPFIRGGNRIHPTQKPVALYEWLLTNYAKKGQRILDTHLGSGSSAIAAHYFGVDFVGCELDKDYFEAAKARFDMATKQLAMSI